MEFVLKNSFVYCTAGIIYINEITGGGGFYPGKRAASRNDIIAEPGALQYFERLQTRTSPESIIVYRRHIIRREFRQ